MNDKDARIIATLAELGLRNQPKLTPEQEEMLKQALDPDLQFAADVKRIFDQIPSNVDN